MPSVVVTDMVGELHAACHGIFPRSAVQHALEETLGGAARDHLRRAHHHLASQVVARAREAGVTAVWTVDHSATIELSRLAGEYDAILAEADAERLGLARNELPILTDPKVRVAVYQHYLEDGTQFDIYRWINLIDLAVTLPHLSLPEGATRDWEHVLEAGGISVHSAVPRQTRTDSFDSYASDVRLLPTRDVSSASQRRSGSGR